MNVTLKFVVCGNVETVGNHGELHKAEAAAASVQAARDAEEAEWKAQAEAEADKAE